MKLVVLVLSALPLILLGCGGGKSKDHNHETPLDLPTHKPNECPSLAGKYKGKAQNRSVIYDFQKAGNVLVAVISVPDLSDKSTPVLVDGKAQNTSLGKAAFGCENGKLNSSSLINGQKNKAQLIPNADGFELKEELPKVATGQFYKTVDP